MRESGLEVRRGDDHRVVELTATWCCVWWRSQVMVHQPSMEMPKMTATDVLIRAEETRRIKVCHALTCTEPNTHKHGQQDRQTDGRTDGRRGKQPDPDSQTPAQAAR